MASPRRNATPQQLVFSDFSKGIVQRTNVLGAIDNSPAQLGAASILNTYRCIALPGGGLGPLPRRVFSLSITDLTTPDIPSTAVVQGFSIMGPVYKGTTPTYPALANRPFEVHLAYEYDVAGTHHHFWRKYPYYSGDPSVPLKNVNYAGTLYASASFAICRFFPPNPLVAGTVCVVGSWKPIQDPDTNVAYASAYPDPTTLITAATDAVYDFGDAIAGPGLGHQARYVSLKRGISYHGANNGVVPINEFIFYTKPNDTAMDGSSVAFGQEYPVGYGAWGSLNASDLLLIKHFGGAYLVQSGLNDPIVRRLPGVVGTAGIESHGASTSIGFVYLVNKDGVYVWQGGDGSTLISPQLEDMFYDTSPLTTNFKGSISAWGEWIVVPYNFLYDTISQSWWRLEDQATATFFMYQRDPINNMLYAARTTIQPGAEYASQYDRGLPAFSFSWQSQPFSLLPMREAAIRSITIYAQGNGTVTVSFTTDGSIDAAPDPAVLSSSAPTRQTKACNISGTEFTMRIISDGGVNPAPIIREIVVEFDDGQALVV